MTEFAKVGSAQIGLLVLGAILMIAVPLMIAIIWTKKKKERLLKKFLRKRVLKRRNANWFSLFQIIKKHISKPMLLAKASRLSS